MKLEGIIRSEIHMKENHKFQTNSVIEYKETKQGKRQWLPNRQWNQTFIFWHRNEVIKWEEGGVGSKIPEKAKDGVKGIFTP